MSVSLTYDAELSRVRVDADDLGGSAEYATVERSRNGVTWQTVRGGTAVEVDAGELHRPVDDYEFHADVSNLYRVRAYDDADELVVEHTDEITPDLAGRIWLKSIIRPFLNRPVVVTDWSEVTRRARNGVFDVVGRSFPVAVTDVRGSREFTLEIMTPTLAEADEFDLILASGDPIFLHLPAGSPVPGSSGHYAVIGDTMMERRATRSPRRYFHLPLTETAPPAPHVVGITYTWQSVLNDFATWAEVLAAHASWAELLEQVGSLEDVIVP